MSYLHRSLSLDTTLGDMLGVGGIGHRHLRFGARWRRQGRSAQANMLPRCDAGLRSVSHAFRRPAAYSRHPAATQLTVHTC